jgi:cobalamin biosynthesis protein CbiG
LPDNSPKGPVAVYVLTGQGLAVARRLESSLDTQLYLSQSVPGGEPDASRGSDSAFLPDPPRAASSLPPHRFSRLADITHERFSEHAGHIFITATGIAVRAVAPLLRGKSVDPAVLVIDQRGRFVISLLSGHLGGANALAMKAAAVLGAVPVITTATDVECLPALDSLAKAKGLGIADMDAVRTISAALLAGQRVMLHDPENRLGMQGSGWEVFFLREPDMRLALAAVSRPRVIVTEQALCRPSADTRKIASGRSLCLALHPRLLYVGVGCRRGTAGEEIVRRILEALAFSGLPPQAVAALASIDAKRAEGGLADAARSLGLDLCFFNREELARYPVSAPSAKALSRFGIQGVCEPAALAAAGRGGRLLVPKKSGGRVSLAIARAPDPLP